MKRIRRLIISCVTIYLGVVVVISLLERFLMYPAPSPDSGDWAPSHLAFEEMLQTTTHGNVVHGWYLEHENPSATILFCHGNGEHVGYLGDELAYLRDRYSVNVLAFDYRGYGKSRGKPFEQGVLTDADAAYAWLTENGHAKPDKIILWGRSLGGAVATHLAGKNGAQLLVLDRTFNSMVDVACDHYPWLPVRLMLRNRYPSEKRIQNYAGPVFQVHGRLDSVVPFESGERLYEAAPGTDKRFLTPEGLTHNSPWPEDVYESLGQTISEL